MAKKTQIEAEQALVEVASLLPFECAYINISDYIVPVYFTNGKALVTQEVAGSLRSGGIVK